MKLTVLTDNTARIDAYYLAEAGVSYYIQDGGKNILFDTGYSDVYVRNAEAMQIDLRQLDTIVFSHGHLSVICYADDGRVSTRLCCCNPPP